MAEDKNLEEDINMNSEEAENSAEEMTDTVEAASEEIAEDNSEADADDMTEEEKESKKFFKKKKDKKDEMIEELNDKYRRTMAEFDNFRKRTEKEKEAMFAIGAKSIIEKILPVVDNFERGIAAIPEESRNTPVAEGMDKIYKQFTKMLEDAGVKEIEALNEEFNPELHNAVMHVEDDSLGENVVAEVLQKGYTYKDTVVRHSMVKVAN